MMRRKGAVVWCGVRKGHVSRRHSSGGVSVGHPLLLTSRWIEANVWRENLKRCVGCHDGSCASTPDNYPSWWKRSAVVCRGSTSGGARECVKFILMIMIMAGTSDLLQGGASYVTQLLFRKLVEKERCAKMVRKWRTYLPLANAEQPSWCRLWRHNDGASVRRDPQRRSANQRLNFFVWYFAVRWDGGELQKEQELHDIKSWPAGHTSALCSARLRYRASSIYKTQLVVKESPSPKHTKEGATPASSFTFFSHHSPSSMLCTFVVPSRSPRENLDSS